MLADVNFQMFVACTLALIVITTWAVYHLWHYRPRPPTLNYNSTEPPTANPVTAVSITEMPVIRSVIDTLEI